MSGEITLIMIRHGKTKGNEEHRYIGRTDESLSEAGSREIVSLTDRYGDMPDVIYVSPMKRCIETACLIYGIERTSLRQDISDEVCRETAGTEFIACEELREMDFGDFEGMNYEELKGNSDYQRFIDEGGCCGFPGGESRTEFIERCKHGFEKIGHDIERRALYKKAKASKLTTTPTVAMVVHGGTIMAILSSMLGGDYYDYQVANLEGYRCRAVLKEDRLVIEEATRI